MEFTHLWFNFKGRINRAKYWLVTLVNSALLVALFLLAVAVNSTALMVLVGLLFIPIVVSSIGVTVTRLHDREKSAWWLLLFYVVPGVLQGIGEGIGGDANLPLLLMSAALSIWAFVEIGCLRGTAGDNRYGPDPLAGQG